MRKRIEPLLLVALAYSLLLFFGGVYVGAFDAPTTEKHAETKEQQPQAQAYEKPVSEKLLDYLAIIEEIEKG